MGAVFDQSGCASALAVDGTDSAEQSRAVYAERPSVGLDLCGLCVDSAAFGADCLSADGAGCGGVSTACDFGTDGAALCESVIGGRGRTDFGADVGGESAHL